MSEVTLCVGSDPFYYSQEGSEKEARLFTRYVPLEREDQE